VVRVIPQVRSLVLIVEVIGMGGDIGMLGLLIERIVAIIGWSVPILAIIVSIVLYIKRRIDNK